MHILPPIGADSNSDTIGTVRYRETGATFRRCHSNEPTNGEDISTTSRRRYQETCFVTPVGMECLRNVLVVVGAAIEANQDEIPSITFRNFRAPSTSAKNRGVHI